MQNSGVWSAYASHTQLVAKKHLERVALRRHDDVGAAGDRVVEVRGEVRRAFDEGLVGYDLAAGSFKGDDEVLGQADGVVVAEHGQDVGLLGAELFHGERGHDGALERIEEADAEVVVVAGGDGCVGAGAADGRDLGVCEVGAGGDGDAGAVGAEDDGDLIGDQLLGRGDGLVGRGLVILDVELDLVFFAANGHGRLDGVGVLDAQDLLLAAGAVVAGLRLKYADLDDLGAADFSR